MLIFQVSLNAIWNSLSLLKSWKKGFKILKNVKVQWISMLEPLKHVLAKYLDGDYEDVIRQH
jgi:hypothetical protein